MVSVRDSDFLTEPLSDEPELENSLHLAQIILLLTCLEWWWQQRQDFFAAGNLSIYYKPEQLKRNTFRGPDFFVVLETERRPRNSWLVSKEGKFPNLIVEILSPKTAKADKTTKKALYQDIFKVPEYFWFDPTVNRSEFKGFRLQAGQYQEIVPNTQGWLWSEQLELYLGVANGMLRYFTADGVIIPNFEEATAQQDQVIAAIERRAEQERLRAEQERLRADTAEAILFQERQDKERLRALLRSRGIDPDTPT